jgi:hypothetical protein
MSIDAATEAGARTDGASPGGEPLLQALLKSLHGGPGQAVLEALTQSADPSTLVRSFLSKAQLSDEHRALVDAMLAAQERAEAQAPRVVDVEPGSYDVVANDDRLELRDLRQVNDTLADALGACRICWGGDGSCDTCGGRGRSGSRAPDMELFEELVAPALRRVLTMRRAGRFGPARSRR